MPREYMVSYSHEFRASKMCELVGRPMILEKPLMLTRTISACTTRSWARRRSHHVILSLLAKDCFTQAFGMERVGTRQESADSSYEKPHLIFLPRRWAEHLLSEG